MSERSLVRQAWIWLASPVVLFIAFWIRAEIAVPVIAATVFCIWRMLWHSPGNLHVHGFHDIPWRRTMYAALLVTAAYVTMSGIGGFVAQIPSDHAWRNAIFYDLARHPWPVRYGDGADAPLLCYYFAFWLPSAIVAKATGFIMAGDAAQLVWAIWGTWIAINMIVSMCGRKAIWSTIAIFIFFNAWDWVTAIFFSDEYFSIFENPWTAHLTWMSTTSDRFSASANPIIYNFIYNQGIPLWVFITLLIHRRNKPGTLLLLLSLLPIYAPIPSLAFIPWITWRLLRSPKEILTLPNVTGLAIAILSSAFLLQNNSGGHFRIVTTDGSVIIQLLMALVYYAISFGPFIPFIWKFIRRDLLYWSLISMAVALSLFGIGVTPDLAWRISLPAVMMTTIMLCRRCSEIKRPFSVTDRLVVMVLAIGSFSSVYTFAYAIHSEILVAKGERERKLIFMMGRLNSREQGLWYDNFNAEGESIYRKWLMPRQPDSAQHVQPKK